MPYYLGVDAGGTTTLAAVCDDSGRVAGTGLAGASNYQDVGTAAAVRAGSGSGRDLGRPSS